MSIAKQREAGLVGAILGLAVVARLPGLLGDGLWRDQANIYVQLSAPTFAEFFHRVTSTEWHPPLFFLIMYGWSRFAGTGELALTSIPFACSIGTVAAVYWLGRSTGSSGAAAVAATLYAVAPLPVAYASEYLYPLMGLVSTMLAVLVVQARYGPLNVGRWWVLGTVTLLVVFTHYLGSIYVALLIGWVLVDGGAVRRRLAVASALVAGALPFVFWLPVFVNQRRIGVPYSAATSGFAKLLLFVYTTAHYVPVRPASLGAFFTALIVVALVTLVRTRALDRAAFVCGLVFVAMLAVTAGLNLMASRYALPYFGLACVALGSIVVGFARRVAASEAAAWRRWGVGAAVSLALLFIGADLASAVAVSQTPKSGIRSIAFLPPRDVTSLYVLAPDYLAATFAFYARASHPAFGGFVRWDRPDVFKLEHYAADWNRVDAVARTLADIARAGRGKTQLDVIVDDAARDAGQVPYGRVNRLLDALAARYRRLGRIRHPGRYEAVSEYRYALWRTSRASQAPVATLGVWRATADTTVAP